METNKISKLFDEKTNEKSELAATPKTPKKAHANRLVIAYAIFATKKGKGYGCFAIQQTSPEEVKIGASFCSPMDSNRFSKTKAKQSAIGRCKSSRSTTLKVSFATQKIHEMIELYIQSTRVFVPTWSRKAFDCGLWQSTLKSDSKDVHEFIVDCFDRSHSRCFDTSHSFDNFDRNLLLKLVDYLY